MMNIGSLKKQIEEWLQEDIGLGDVSAQATVPATLEGVGILYAKGDGVIAGLGVAEMVFQVLDSTLVFEAKVSDGEHVTKGTVIAEVSGKVQAILTGERLALNLLQRMSGIATMTHKFAVEAAKGNPHVRVVDTRKTTPGLRMLEKYAVRAGGGHNHRFGLFDAVMIKDNHIKAAGGIQEAVRSAREAIPHTMTIEVEVESIGQVHEALEAGADIIMLDNMSLEEMKQAVEIIAGKAVVEASGGVTLESISSIASTGVNIISAGALTHSVQALDISLDLNQRKR